MFLAQGSAALMHAQVVGRVRVGPLPVHGYNIPQLGQFWAHSDIDGTFYIIPVDNINGSAATVAVRAVMWPFCNLGSSPQNLTGHCCHPRPC